MRQFGVVVACGCVLAGCQEFYADEHTAQLIPAAATNIWTVEIVPQQHSRMRDGVKVWTAASV